MNAMTLPSRINPGHVDFGRNRELAPQPIAQWTDYERRCNRIIEDLMIVEAAKLKKRQRDDAEERDRERYREEFWKPIIEALDGQMTTQDIAAVVGRSAGAVASTMRSIEKHGLVIRHDQGRSANGQQLPFIWTRADGRSCHIANRQKGERTRQEALAAMDGPTTANELADRLGHSPHHCQQVMRELERQGRVKRAGKGPRVHGKGSAPTLWIKA